MYVKLFITSQTNIINQMNLLETDENCFLIDFSGKFGEKFFYKIPEVWCKLKIFWWSLFRPQTTSVMCFDHFVTNLDHKIFFEIFWIFFENFKGSPL